MTLNQSCRVEHGVNYYPQQIHLVCAGTPAGTGMTVSWATFEDVADSAVWIGTSASSLTKSSAEVNTVAYYKDVNYTLFHHHVTVTGLKAHTKYFYKVGSVSKPTYHSDVLSFVTARSANDTSPFKMIIYGDAGDGANSASLISYVNTLTSSDIDAIFHVGDISYADDDFLMESQAAGFFYEEVYNKWMNSLMPIMSQVPYMVLVGSHEAECHSTACQLSQSKKDQLGYYTASNNRFKMPSDESDGTLNMWYSFDHGPIHFTVISSETDYAGAPTNEFTLTNKNGNFGNQLAWVEADLKKAQANRANVPWVFVCMHRPIYSVATANVTTGVTTDDQTAAIQKAFEALFVKYKVDIVLTGHEHYYERQLPIVRNKAVTPGVSSDKKTYKNVLAPVYMITGATGNVEDLDFAPSGTVSWNAHHDYTHYGFNTLTANRTVLSWKYLANSDRSVLDEFVMIKTI